MSSEQEERRQQTSPTAGQMSRRRRHGSQKRVVINRPPTEARSTPSGFLTVLLCCQTSGNPLRFARYIFSVSPLSTLFQGFLLQERNLPVLACGKPANVRRKTHTHIYQEGNLMAPRLLERVNVPPPGCQLMGSGGPRLEKLRWSEDLWSHSALEGGGLGVRSWG